MRCLALDFGGSSIKYGLVDNHAQIRNSGKVPAPLDSEAQFVETVSALYDRFRDQISGIAISMPGYIDPVSGVLFDSGAYRPLYGKSIPALLKARCPVPMAIENDGKCAALAESWTGALKDCRDGAVIVLGTAIAGGILKDGHIHSGRDFAAGELSYLITDPEKTGHMSYAYMGAGLLGMTYRICKMKNLNLDVQDSAPTLHFVDETVQMPYAHPDAPLKPICANGVQIFKWLEEGDADARAVYQIFIRTLAMIVHNIQICFAPEKIAIGGGLSLQQRIFSDVEAELERYYRESGLAHQLHAVVTKCRYLDECNLVGAMCNFLQRTGEKPLETLKKEVEYA